MFAARSFGDDVRFALARMSSDMRWFCASRVDDARASELSE